jgi:hypothetical protein
MKKILIIALATILATVTAFAGSFSNTYRLSGFTGIRASSIYHIELSPSSSFSVDIEAPDYMEPYLVVEVVNNQLVLRVKDMPKSISKRLSDERVGSIRAEVRMPRLESVSLSGAAALNAEGDFPALRDRSFKLDLSGATHAKGLNVSAPSAVISLSGATEATLTGRFNKVSIDASGASKLKMDTETPELDAELSGSARADLKGRFTEVSLETSGAARVDIDSDKVLTELEIEGSGAASIDTRNAKAQEVSVELSGAANCKVSALRSFTVEATGASTVAYESATDTRINIVQVARGASLKKL